jgi:hypothetical protein
MPVKEQIRNSLITEDYVTITKLAERTNRVLSFLTALTYDEDPLVCWRAIEAIGLAAARIADRDPEVVRVHLRRMQWLLNDESGGIGWRLPEAMAEIIYNRPQCFAEFVPIVISLFDMEEEDAIRFRAGILWAVGRLAQVIPQSLDEALPWATSLLQDPDPRVRGMAVWCLGQLGATESLVEHQALLDDHSPVTLYSHGQLIQKTISNLAREAITIKANDG